ncbi:hypothetical protein [Acidisoma cladoniae]|jgi:hypothetical protein|uniref:hypothetical protein n=1 Tax=Acidisoma cladoniae TaxID=3040935 RepID=UPI00254CD7CF|nr:hypothetical protein [Acidisoma sp. PAMC 29798]
MDPETHTRLGAVIGNVLSLRAELVALQARIDALRRQSALITHTIDRSAAQAAIIKHHLTKAAQTHKGRVAPRPSGEPARVTLPPGSQSKWPANDLLDLSPLSPRELLKAKPILNESAFWVMVYLAVHHIPCTLAVAFTAEQRSLLATAVQRTAQDNMP